MNTSYDEPEQDDIFRTPNIDEGQDTEIVRTSSFTKTLKKMKTSNLNQNYRIFLQLKRQFQNRCRNNINIKIDR